MYPPGIKIEFVPAGLILHYRPVENTLILRGLHEDSTQKIAFLQGYLLLAVQKWAKYAYQKSYVRVR
jgi:hypothetical protein